MQSLNFPKFNFRFKNSEKGVQIFDIIRKKFVVLQPEEWVRQHAVHYLIENLNYPKNYINVEKQLKLNKLTKRTDIIVFDAIGNLEILVECKAPYVNIDQLTFDQIARYNLAANAKFLMVTNGLSHYYCQMDYGDEKYNFIPELPEFSR
ncbi:type I restriction enzyme HsdR N-terminal domain-containing protein [Croceivirga thetidis]|uniref:Type I restriction enzyme HsdR N-terminal domain-containing protein n=1 Tax=Croceivirga thetidis TaxID=2721623 RepID=A0ABX1GS43_9FLAO|nr:type I restriction enzyme HsdR N-terminal domain-containing protein [Croceivirga thetidis]NKI32429.1 type I restriction enzyme HsdR N-terminal domain-containing protein [Croceivirga thetidis]